MKNNMEDSGKRQEFESGAVRDSADGKSRPDLQSPYAQERIGHWLRLGAEKYNERNWEAGMSFSRCVASIERHLVAYKMGRREEDHLAAIAVNAQFLMHYEAMIQSGGLSISLDDMPHYEDRRKPVAVVLEQQIEVMEPIPQPVPQFKAGDMVKIKMREETNNSSLDMICIRSGNGGIYAGCMAGDKHYVKMSDGKEWGFYTDELTLVEDN